MRTQGLMRLFLAAVLAVFMASGVAVARKGNGNGNGGGNGGGDNNGGGGSPTLFPGEIVAVSSEPVIYPNSNATTIEYKSDGSSVEQIDVAGDPSNLSFANGERWYLEVRENDSLPYYINGEHQGELSFGNVFAVNSLTGHAMQLTDFRGDGMYITEACTWARDAGDSYIFGTFEEESQYLTTINGELAYDFTNFVGNEPRKVFRLDVSSPAVDAAYRAGGALPKATRSELLEINYGGADQIEHFRTSPDGTMAFYRKLHLDIRLFDMATGATIAVFPDARQADFSKDSSKLVYSVGIDEIHVYDIASGTSMLVTQSINKEQSRLGYPLFNLDGSAIIYQARVYVGRGNYESMPVLLESNGSRHALASVPAFAPQRWVQD